ncbi:MAG: tRNA (adenosine(37)-N6)-threonylcarbamoyltransferase complex ATPase subunit type 1 TsaE [Candidatus Harrisonbacteria bacterium]|nr:tRNA (adenosine(37)-N6)-threonylcarbamoyltransferase complex ATPase subunit type 1 TsaE [Candidatus Harrisonbacteria bacterium]
MISKSAQETKKIAAKLAKKILKEKPHQKHARVIALTGELGAGKTTFVQGFAKALGIKSRMVSPTFLIFRKYKNFYHVDVYRIHSTKELDVLNFKSILNSSENILLIEWAEKIRKILPKDAIWVNFRHGRKENERFIAY